MTTHTEAERSFNQQQYSVHSVSSQSSTKSYHSHQGVSLPNTPLTAKSDPIFNNGLQKKYDVKGYQESPLNTQQQSGSVQDLLNKNLEFELRKPHQNRELASPSLSSTSSQPGPLDFTIGSKDSESSGDRLHNVTVGDELDISLEHETKLRPQRYHSATNLAGNKVHHAVMLRSETPNLTRPVQIRRMRSHSVENLNRAPLATGQNKWNVVDIDIDATPSNVQQPHKAKHYNSHSELNSNSDRTVTTKERAPAINSARLRPIRQKTRNAVVNIMDDGTVCLEFFKKRDSEEKVLEVFWISSDGLQVGTNKRWCWRDIDYLL